MFIIHYTRTEHHGEPEECTDSASTYKSQIDIIWSLAKRSTVPASTIKKFETTGQISLRQLLLIWQSIDDLNAINQLTKPVPASPQSIDEVLNS